MQEKVYFVAQKLAYIEKKLYFCSVKLQNFDTIMTTGLTINVPSYVPSVELPAIKHQMEQLLLLLYPRPSRVQSRKMWASAFEGKWEDTDTAEEMLDEIRRSRTANRDVML